MRLTQFLKRFLSSGATPAKAKSLEGSHSRVDISENFKEGSEADCIEYFQDILVRVEQFNVFLDTAVLIFCHGADSGPAFFQIRAIFATVHPGNPVQSRNPGAA
jgi:hypothetical protein